jgi:20S proteasome alpha/beta subunit
MYTIKEEREITPVTFAHLVSSTLYERRFGPYFIEPVVAGLDPIAVPEGTDASAPRKFKPFIASTDLIGCINWAKVSWFAVGLKETVLMHICVGFCSIRNGIRKVVRCSRRPVGA